MPRKVDFSSRTAQRVLLDRGLEQEASVGELAEAAEAHDLHNPGYLSRDELEHGASRLAAQLGRDDTEIRDGLSYSRQLLDAAKAKLGEAGIWISDAQIRTILTRLDDGDGQVSLDEVNRAVRMIREVARLDALEALEPPPRPAAVAEAEGATAALGRRKLGAGFRYAGQGPIKVAFFDADSTLRVSRSGKVSANGPRDVALLPFVAERLRQLSEQGYLLAVVSNQSGVRYGHVSIEDADEALQYTADLIRAAGGVVDYIDFAETGDDNRKPQTGMASRLEACLTDTFGADAVIDKDASLMCGDSAYKSSEVRPDGSPGTSFSNSDRRFAENLGVRFEEPCETFGWAELGIAQIDDLRGLQAMTAPFDVGRRSKGSPLFARFQEIAPTAVAPDPGDEPD